jgi:DNA (cytosine-5)-methyltransferase 1
MRVLDLFCGMGGWDEAARELGIDAIGIDSDAAACRVNAAAGGRPVLADVAALEPHRFGALDGLIASPPCTDFSAAGKRAGIAGETGHLIFEVPRFAEALRPRWIVCEQVPAVLEWWERIGRGLGARGYHWWAGILNAADYGVAQTRQRAFLIASLESEPRPPAPTHARHPQAPLFGDELLPWVSMAQALGWGALDCASPTVTSGGTGSGGGVEPIGNFGRELLNRERAKGRWVNTRGERKTQGGHGFDPGDPSWALSTRSYSWKLQTGNNSHVTSRTGSKAGEGGVELYERPISEPAPTLDAKAGAAWRVIGVNTGRDWKTGGTREDAQIVSPDEPASAIDGKGRWHALVAQGVWPEDRPATTLSSKPAVPAPGHRDRAGGERQFAEKAIRLGIVDALILQGFPAWYPIEAAGGKTKQFECVGNAVPPPIARRVLESVL